MSQDPENQYSSPTSGGRLILRVILVGGLIIAGVVGIVWYTSK